MVKRVVTRLLTSVFVVISLLQFFSIFAAEQDENIVWIDVRSAGDFRQGHLEGAVNIYHGDIGHKIFQSVTDLFKEIHIYDGSEGTFAGLSLEMLMEMGFQEVINEGGYEDVLSKQGLDEQ